MAKFILEGEWSGYTSTQRRVVHREVIDARRAKALKVRSIVYTDGTSLALSLREAETREKVVPVNSYGSLIRAAEATGKVHVTVAELP